jgi:Lrp/AsnC family transcriptional regulator, leucine-responsive regulatory protein
VELDRIDRRILHELQLNARITNQELADKVGLSPSPCLRRVKHLEEAGLIKGYVTELWADKLGLKLMAIVQVAMDRHTPDRFEQFEAAIKTFPQVLECIMITGQSADYQLKVLVKDMDEYQAFLLSKLTRITGVSDVRSSFVLRQIVSTSALPLEL